LAIAVISSADYPEAFCRIKGKTVSVLFCLDAGAQLVAYNYCNALLEGKPTSPSPAGNLCTPQKLALRGSLIIKEE